MPSDLFEFSEFALMVLDEDPLSYPSVIKEVIHIETLRAMSEVGLFKHLVFQGDTAIRLCHGGLRYSEDLDFSTTRELLDGPMRMFFECLYERFVRFGLDMANPEVTVHKDFRDRGGPRSWRSKIIVPPPVGNRSDIRSFHYVKIEVDDREVFERVVRPVKVRHSQLGQQGTLVATKTANELMVDKSIAFIDRKTMKWRDLFDIHQLSRRGTVLDCDLLETKMKARYKDGGRVKQLIDFRHRNLQDEQKRNGFSLEMMPLLPSKVRQIWSDESVVDGITENAHLILDQLSKCMDTLGFERGHGH